MLVIYEEYCLREEAGEEVDPEEFIARFPHWGVLLRVVSIAISCFKPSRPSFPKSEPTWASSA